MDSTAQSSDRLFQFSRRMVGLAVIGIPLASYLAAACIATFFFTKALERAAAHMMGLALSQCADTLEALSEDPATEVDTALMSPVLGAAAQHLRADVFLLAEDGRLLASSGTGAEKRLPDMADCPTLQDKPSVWNRSLCASSPVHNGRWRLIARMKTTPALPALVYNSLHIAGFLLLGGLIVLMLAVTAGRKIVRTLAEADEIRDHLRNRLSRSTRLAELGEMTSGFAHEINNPLQIMESEITMMDFVLEDYVHETEPDTDALDRNLRESLAQLQEQIRRCSKITKSILMFAKQDLTERTRICVLDTLREIAGMVANKVDMQSIALRIGADPRDMEINNDVGKLRQVLLNLVNNAIDAVVDRHGRTGGHIDVTAAPAGRGWIRIAVADNGPGLPPDILATMYTPFFTTKPPQKGKGLGLAVCYGLVESMGGTIDVETRQNRGTTFTITLPAS